MYRGNIDNFIQNQLIFCPFSAFFQLVVPILFFLHFISLQQLVQAQRFISSRYFIFLFQGINVKGIFIILIWFDFSSHLFPFLCFLAHSFVIFIWLSLELAELIFFFLFLFFFVQTLDISSYTLLEFLQSDPLLSMRL